MSPAEAAVQISRQTISLSTEKLALVVAAVAALPPQTKIKTVELSWDELTSHGTATVVPNLTIECFP